ncbi:MAG: hypothetical protein ACE5R6_02440 [Candidatus Heimdallarchaeota archaeon]
MTKNKDWNKIERRVFRDTQQDGLMELLSGLGMVYIAGMVTGKLSPVFIALIVLFFTPALGALRRRFTYPRIGYVKLPEVQSNLVWRGIFLVMLGLLIIITIALTLIGEMRNVERWLNWIPAFLGIVYVGMFLKLAVKSKNTRYYGYSIFSVINGFSFSLLTFESWRTGIEMYFLSMGGVLMITGFALFLRFLRTNPLPTDESSIKEMIDNTEIK